MNTFPGMGNFDPSKMDPAQMKQMLNLFSGMSDDQIKNSPGQILNNESKTSQIEDNNALNSRTNSFMSSEVERPQNE